MKLLLILLALALTAQAVETEPVKSDCKPVYFPPDNHNHKDRNLALAVAAVVVVGVSVHIAFGKHAPTKVKAVTYRFGLREAKK